MDIRALLVMLLLGVSGCSVIQEKSQKRGADEARSEAEKLGHSGPLYEYYEQCLNRSWEEALDAGADALGAYDTGVKHCTYELSLLCDFYGVSTCFEDAEASNRLLFRLLREQYASKLAY